MRDDASEKPVNGMIPAQPFNDRSQDAAPELSDAMGQLRRLLLAPETDQLQSLRRRLDDPEERARDLSLVLADAIKRRKHPDEELSTALAPTLQGAFKVAVQQDPQTIADAISPIMGPAIRKSITDALTALVQSFNQTLEYSLSPKSWRWRLEALKTGRSFAEIVMLHTLRFRVEQVFLIHLKSGLLLQHLVASEDVTQDADMVSGMLSAIRDFGRDAMNVGDAEPMKRTDYGAFDLWVEQGPFAYLATVISGKAPERVRQVMQETLEQVHVLQGAQLENFGGAPSVFEKSRPILQRCLLEGKGDAKAKTEGATQKKKLPIPALIVLVIVLLAVGTWVYFGVKNHIREGRTEQAWGRYLAQLRGTPGLVITRAEHKDGRFRVEGLRDPHTVDPQSLLQHSGLDAALLDQRWEPFVSTAFAAEWMRSMLQPPPGVKATLSNGTLVLSGTAPGQWITQASRLAMLVPGVNRLDSQGLMVNDALPVISPIDIAKAALDPPDTVTLTVSSGVLSASGTALQAWIERANRIAPTLPGVITYNGQVTAAVDQSQIDRERRQKELTRLEAELAGIEQARRTIESCSVTFFLLTADVMSGQDKSLKDVSTAMDTLSRLRGKDYQVEIVAHAATGSGRQFQPELARQRAIVIRDALVARGVDLTLLKVVAEALPPAQAEGNAQANRSATFRVVLPGLTTQPVKQP